MLQANITQAELAFDAVLAGTHDFKNEPREELGTYVGDLLANLMHLCDRDGIDFEECLRKGRMHYSAEKGHYDSTDTINGAKDETEPCEIEWERPKGLCRPHRCSLVKMHLGNHICDCGWRRRLLQRDEPERFESPSEI